MPIDADLTYFTMHSIFLVNHYHSIISKTLHTMQSLLAGCFDGYAWADQDSRQPEHINIGSYDSQDDSKCLTLFITIQLKNKQHIDRVEQQET